ncbi:MAG: NAD-glutamate dehydrogenase [Altererythrobacter sp.]
MARKARSSAFVAKAQKQVLADASFDRAFAWFDDPKLRKGRVPLVIKANVLSNVHRRVPLDLFLVPIEEDGKVTAISVHSGVWTSAALAASPAEIPGLRANLTELMAKFGFDAGGCTGKALVHALTALPHDLVIGFARGYRPRCHDRDEPGRPPASATVWSSARSRAICSPSSGCRATCFRPSCATRSSRCWRIRPAPRC